MESKVKSTDKKPAEKKKVTSTSRKASAPALPSGVKQSFDENHQIKEAFICTAGEKKGQWYFSQQKANKHFPGVYKIVQNPNHKK